MKRILIVFLLLFLAVISYGQNSPVVKKTVYFYADSLATLSLEKGLYLSGIYMPRGETVSLGFNVSNGTSYYRMSEDGSNYSITVDSTQATFIPLPPTKFYSAKTLQLIIGSDPADTVAVVVDLRTY